MSEDRTKPHRMIGKLIIYRDSRRRNGPMDRERSGTITGVEKVRMMNRKTGRAFWGAKFRIKPENGRAFWTRGMRATP